MGVADLHFVHVRHVLHALRVPADPSSAGIDCAMGVGVGFPADLHFVHVCHVLHALQVQAVLAMRPNRASSRTSPRKAAEAHPSEVSFEPIESKKHQNILEATAHTSL